MFPSISETPFRAGSDVSANAQQIQPGECISVTLRDAMWLMALATGEWLGLVGLIIGIVGFGVTIYQVVLAKRQAKRAVAAAEAARDAVQRTERLSALLELMAVIPQMQRLERDLSIATRDNNRAAVENQLQDWRTLAAETRGLLEKHDFDTASLESRLHESSSSAAQAVSLLDTADIPTATKWVVTMIATATEEGTALMGRLKAHPSTTQGEQA